MPNRRLSSLNKKIEYSGLYDRVQGLSYEGRYRWATYHLFIEEKCTTQHYQDNIGISVIRWK